MKLVDILDRRGDKMKGKFSTTSSSFFNKENLNNNVPDWMQDLNVELKKKESIDLGIAAKGAFAEKNTVYRQELDATPKQVTASFNDTRLLNSAKVELAKFLVGKYYRVEGKVNGNVSILNVQLDSIPGEFAFNYSANNGKITASNTFIVTTNDTNYEYPHSKAGFEECIGDIKKGRLKTAGSKKVAGVGKTFVINREEIVRRYNGHLRQATDKINELLTEGSIVGAGSNSYASFYDVDQLFPQMQKEAGEAPLPAFEFAPNQEHVASKEHKSANVLSIEASKTLSKLFNDHMIKRCVRDNNELLVKAEILSSNGTCNTVDFNFGIQNEKLASLKVAEMNDERMTVEQLLTKLNMNNNALDNYLSTNKTAATKHIYRGVVFTKKEFNRRLGQIVKKATINDVIDNWTERGLIQPVNSTTFTTTNSFEQLLASVNVQTLSAEEKEAITEYSRKFGAGLEMERQNIKDTGVRYEEHIECSESKRMQNAIKHMAKYFKNFKIGKWYQVGPSLDGTYSQEYDVAFVDQNGTKNNIVISAQFDRNKVEKMQAKIAGNNVSLEKLSEFFVKSPVLSAYLQERGSHVNNGQIIMSINNIKRSLSSVASKEEINKAIDGWFNTNLIEDLGNNVIASSHSFEDLLNNSDIKVLSDSDREEILLAKQHFGNAFEREDVKDTGVREMDEYVSDDTILMSANNFLTKHFSNFKTEGYHIDGECLTYSIRLFDDESGLSSNVHMSFDMDGNKVIECNANLNGEKVALKNIKRAFASNEVLNRYLQTNTGKKFDSPIIMSETNLANKLIKASNATSDEIVETVNLWSKTGKIDQIGSNVFASKYTFEQLLSMSNLKALSDEEVKQRLLKSKRNREKEITSGHIQDSDTRELNNIWTPERMLVFAKQTLGRQFKDFEILNAEVNDNMYGVEFRAVNPTNGIRQKIAANFVMVDDKVSKLLSLTACGKSTVKDLNEIALHNEAVDTFASRNKVNNRSYKNVISNRILRNKLQSVINMEEFDTIVASLVDNELLKPLDSNNFASKYSMGEIVNHLNRFKQANLEKGQEQLENAKHDELNIKISDKRIMDNDSRAIEAKELELSPDMIKLRDKIQSTANLAGKQKKITANKHNQINDMLSDAKCENDLEVAWKELKRYF